MEQELQAEFRKEIYKKYMQRSFEALAIYSYWGERYSKVDAMLKEYEGRIKESEKKLADPSHAVFNGLDERQARELKKGIRNDIHTYQKLLKQMQPNAKKLFENGAQCREEAMTCMEQADVVKNFKVATPEEIAKNKAAQEVADKEPVKEPGEVKAE